MRGSLDLEPESDREAESVSQERPEGAQHLQVGSGGQRVQKSHGSARVVNRLEVLIDPAFNDFKRLRPGKLLAEVLTQRAVRAEERSNRKTSAEKELAQLGVHLNQPLPATGLGVFEVVIPLVPPSRNDPQRVERFAERLRTSFKPTAVSLSILTVHNHYNEDEFHWMLTHFLLDGHHKMQAAAQSGRALQLVSLLSAETAERGGLGLIRPFERSGDEFERLPKIRAGPPGT